MRGRRGRGGGQKGRERRKRHAVRKAAGYILLLAVLAVVPVYENSAIGYLPVLTFLFATAVSFAYPRIMARGLESGLLLDRSTCLRDTDVKLLVRFRSSLPLVCPRVDAELRVTDIFGQDDTTSSFSFSLGPKATRDFELGVRFAHIGTVSAGLKEVTVYDPFGFFSCAVDVGEGQEIEVLPNIYQVDASLVRSLQLKEAADSMTPFGNDGMDYSEVREYVFGDPLKSIHWKLSSHADCLYTRLFETVGEPEIDIMCATDFGSHDSQTLMSLYDAEVETALSVFDFGVESGLRMRIVFGGSGGERVVFDSLHRPDHRSILHEFPLPLSERKADALPELLGRRSHSALGGSNLVVCTAHLDDALVDALTAIDKGRSRVILFLLLPSGLDSAERRELMRPLRRLEQDNVSCFAIERAAELEDVAYE